MNGNSQRNVVLVLVNARQRLLLGHLFEQYIYHSCHQQSSVCGKSTGFFDGIIYLYERLFLCQTATRIIIIITIIINFIRIAHVGNAIIHYIA